MDIDDWVFVINSADTRFGQKLLIKAVQTDFDGRITQYTLDDRGTYRDYAPEDVQYTTRRRKRISSQMQLL